MKRSSELNPSAARSAIGREHEAHRDPRWAVRDAERIADHARLRSEYARVSQPFLQ